ncbi:MAG: hypothetical protein JOZ82_13235 [Marmoricola sp.]|nr:hypothetical protein [Marmoricola sp.]
MTYPETQSPLTHAVRLVAGNPLSGLADRLLTALTAPLVPGEDSLTRTTALGHDLHPVLTDLPLGLWTAASLLDALGGRRSRPAATRLVGLGLLAAGPTAYAGLAAWSGLQGEDRRLGAVHAIGNDVAIVLFAGSWLARVRGRHWKGVQYALLGNLATAAAGHLGGVLALERGTAELS